MVGDEKPAFFFEWPKDGRVSLGEICREGSVNQSVAGTCYLTTTCHGNDEMQIYDVITRNGALRSSGR